jgi:Tfp pilus assembly protein PilF
VQCSTLQADRFSTYTARSFQIMRGIREIVAAIVLIVALVILPERGTSQISDARVKHALQVLEVGSPRQAIEALKKVIAESPKLAEAHAVLAMAYLENKQLDLAATSAQTAFDLDRKSVLARQSRAMVYGRQGKVEDALKEFYQAIKLNDKEIGSYLALSRYYLTLAPDSMKQAEVMLYRAQAINDKDVRSYLGLGELYEKQRIPDLAISQYEAAKKLDPKDVTVGAKLAALYFRDRRYTESINEWMNVVRIDSTFSQAYYQIGRLYFLAEQYGNAVGYLERYVALEPEDLEGYWLLAQALTESGQYAKALPYLEKLAINDSLKSRSQLLLVL